MKEKIKDNRYVITILMAVVFGLIGGITGGFLSRTYLMGNFYDFPIFGQIDFNADQNREIVISNARKVVVDQNTKVNEAINSSKDSIVGIFKKQKVSANASQTAFSPANFYNMNLPLAQGLIITSDGWIVVLPKQGQGDLVNASDYVAITQNKDVYAADKIIKDGLTGYTFLHVGARDLPIKQFADKSDLKNGNLILAVNWAGEGWLSSISGKGVNDSLIYQSDSFFNKLSLADVPPQEFKGSIIFDLGGSVMGLINAKGEIEPITHFKGVVLSLLRYQKIKRPSLGVNYFDLSRVAGMEKNQNGALLYAVSGATAVAKGSAAEAAGLKAGDIITSFDNIEINQNNNLTELVQSYLPGDKIRLEYLRNGTKSGVDVTLAEIK